MNTLTLSQTLNALPHGERNAALNDLVTNGLTSSEVRYLLSHLNSEIGRAAKALWEGINLPLELIVCISEYLDLEDIIRVRRVSHSWNDKFSSPEFCLSIMKLHFRGPYERDYLPLASHEKEVRKQYLGEWLRVAIRHRTRRKRGHQYKPSRHYYIPTASSDIPLRNDYPGWFVPATCRYCNGKIAFQEIDGDAKIFVHHLNGSPNMIFLEPDRQGLGTWLLSDQFLVASNIGKLTLLAWPLSDHVAAGNKPYSVHLYSKVNRISARGSQVGIITTAYEVLIWDVGGQLRNIDISQVNKTLLNHKEVAYPIEIVFHPINKDHFFIFYLDSKHNKNIENMDCRHRIVVQEFGAGGQQGFFSARLSGCATVPSTVNIRPIDADGLYSINILSTSLQPGMGHCSTTFNLYTKQFSSLHHNLWQIPHDQIGDHSNALRFHTHMWRGDLLVPVSYFDVDSSEFKDVLLLSLDEQSKIDRWYANSEDVKEWEGMLRDVDGDDDYLVLFGNPGCYFVWNFKEA